MEHLCIWSVTNEIRRMIVNEFHVVCRCSIETGNVAPDSLWMANAAI
jgi:hypothetical protein